MKHQLLNSLALGGALVLGGLATVSAHAGTGMQAHYQVSVTNLTANQPLSPLAWVVHGPAYHPMQIGSAASAGLERLAESGDTSLWLTEARAHSSVYRTQTGDAVVVPGAHAQFMLGIPATLDKPYLSAATMLVNTNDAFAAVDAYPLANLAVGDSVTFTANVYDAGTETNSEAAGTIPGPADGGEGFNAERESANKVTAHAGVVTKDDGLETSVLNESHRFQNPAIKVKITRMADTAIQTVLNFGALQHQYNGGDPVVISVTESPSVRSKITDLWFALQTPDGVILYVSPNGLSLERQPFKRDIAVGEDAHTLMNMLLPQGLSGRYGLFAAYGKLDGERMQLDSSIAQQTVWLMP